MWARTRLDGVDVRRHGPARTSTRRRPGRPRRRRGRCRAVATVREPPRPDAALEVADDRPPARLREPLRLCPDVHDLDDAGRLDAGEPRDATATRTVCSGTPHTLPSSRPEHPRSARSPGCREPVGLSRRSSVRVRDAHGTPVKAGGRAVRTWLSGRASPCQGEGRGFESRRPLGGRHPDRLTAAAEDCGLRWSGREARQRPAKPYTWVRIPSPPRSTSSSTRVHHGRLAQR